MRSSQPGSSPSLSRVLKSRVGRYEMCLKLVIILLAVLPRNDGISPEDSGVFGKLKSGFKLAGQILGLDRANGVAELVSEAFGKTRRGDDGANKNIFSGFFRILGLDAKKIGAIAVNAIIFVAQLISTSLSKPAPPQVTRAKEGDQESPYEWLLKNERLSEVLKASKDANLSNRITEYIQERSLDEDSGCLQLLICKTAPFVSAMQKAINAKDEDRKKGKDALSQFMPTLDEVADHADDCESKHPYCIIHY